MRIPVSCRVQAAAGDSRAEAAPPTPLPSRRALTLERDPRFARAFPFRRRSLATVRGGRRPSSGAEAPTRTADGGAGLGTASAGTRLPPLARRLMVSTVGHKPSRLGPSFGVRRQARQPFGV